MHKHLNQTVEMDTEKLQTCSGMTSYRTGWFSGPFYFTILPNVQKQRCVTKTKKDFTITIIPCDDDNKN